LSLLYLACIATHDAVRSECRSHHESTRNHAEGDFDSRNSIFHAHYRKWPILKDWVYLWRERDNPILASVQAQMNCFGP
jgi:hypothetical protein